MYIFAAIDYFFKWAEAIALKEVRKETVADFIRTRIIFWYGAPRSIVTNNDKSFFNKLMSSLCDKFKFPNTSHQCITHLLMV